MDNVAVNIVKLNYQQKYAEKIFEIFINLTERLPTSLRLTHARLHAYLSMYMFLPVLVSNHCSTSFPDSFNVFNAGHSNCWASCHSLAHWQINWALESDAWKWSTLNRHCGTWMETVAFKHNAWLKRLKWQLPSTIRNKYLISDNSQVWFPGFLASIIIIYNHTLTLNITRQENNTKSELYAMHILGLISTALMSPVYVPPRDETAGHVSSKACLWIM